MVMYSIMDNFKQHDNHSLLPAQPLLRGHGVILKITVLLL
jgi:hypothetical protein